MSRSKRKVKKTVWFCRCWLCDPDGSKKKHKDQKVRPDPELRKELKEVA